MGRIDGRSPIVYQIVSFGVSVRCAWSARR